MCISMSTKKSDSNIYFSVGEKKRADVVFVVGSNGWESLKKKKKKYDANKKKEKEKMEQLNQCTGKKKNASHKGKEIIPREKCDDF